MSGKFIDTMKEESQELGVICMHASIDRGGVFTETDLDRIELAAHRLLEAVRREREQ